MSDMPTSFPFDLEEIFFENDDETWHDIDVEIVDDMMSNMPRSELEEIESDENTIEELLGRVILRMNPIFEQTELGISNNVQPNEIEEIENDEQVVERVMTESAELFRTVPATKLSIEALNEVKLDDLESSLLVEQCIICLEKFSFNNNYHDEVMLVRMPCSHLFHKGCIVKWLETSHVCPLCRYAMPT